MTNNSQPGAAPTGGFTITSFRLTGIRLTGLFLCLFAALILLLPAASLAKMDTSRIRITGPGITSPIDITDSETVKKFHVWTGLGTSSNEDVGFIVNWYQGVVATRPDGLQRFEVSVYGKCPEEQLIYVVFYEFDPAAEQGYIYLPGKDDERYRRNVWSIYRGVEGSWFRASRAWESVARPLIAKQSKPGRGVR